MIEQNTIPQLEAGTQKAQGVLDASIKTLHACQTEHQQQKAKAEGLHTNAMDAYAAKLSAEKEMAELVQKIGTMEERGIAGRWWYGGPPGGLKKEGNLGSIRIHHSKFRTLHFVMERVFGLSGNMI